MPNIHIFKARLDSLRRNLPEQPTEAEVQSFNTMVHELALLLGADELDHFQIADSELHRNFLIWTPPSEPVYTDDRYCDATVFKRQVEGLWTYLESVGAVSTRGSRQSSRPRHPQPSQVINIHGSVSGSTFQQGNHNTATVNYQTDVRQILNEIKTALGHPALTGAAREELAADIGTVETQLKSPNPKRGIVSESLHSVRHILEHAMGATIAQTFPLLSDFLKNQ
jgi:hypothetical protein